MKIRWLERAAVDLEEAAEYILADNPVAAGKELDKVLEAVCRVSERPGIGRAGRVPGTREWVVTGTPFLVVYRVKEDSLEVLRILHGARRWPGLPGG